MNILQFNCFAIQTHTVQNAHTPQSPCALHVSRKQKCDDPKQNALKSDCANIIIAIIARANSNVMGLLQIHPNMDTTM